MAGLQACMRNAFVVRNLLGASGKGGLQQFARRRHLLTLVVTNKKTAHSCKNSNVFCNVKNLLRHASTSGVIVGDKGVAGTPDIAVKAIDSKNTLTEVPQVLSTTKVPHTLEESNTISNVVIDESLLPPIPTIPSEEIASAAVTAVSDLGEPTLSSLGLGGWWPTGIIQNYMEFLHINLDLPWWGAIAVVTVSLRILVFPLYVKSRRNAVELQNNMPQLQIYQMKVNKARLTGNYYDVAKTMSELQNFMQEKKVGGLGPFLPTLAQSPIFLSMFWGLRAMTNAPVESMKTGGVFWFPDLTIGDPYYILPALITLTLYASIQTGAEGHSLQAQQVWVKYGLKALPFILLPFTINFSAALQLYWTFSNLFTLSQVILFKVPIVIKWAKIPELIKHDPETGPQTPKKGVIAEFKESMATARILNELADRQRMSSYTFEKAGSGPVPRTFKKDPTQIKASKN